jgi:hypothetical protein
MPTESAIDHHMDGQKRPRGVDGRIGERAAAQHGVVARAQLLELGLGPGAIDRRLERGRLRLVHRGVYAVGHDALTRHGHWMAGVLSCGPDAVLRHRTAAALWGFRLSSSPLIEVFVPAPRKLRRRGDLRPHRTSLFADEVALEDGIPVTSVARTVLDLAEVMRRPQHERVADRAEALYPGTAQQLERLVARHPGKRGVAVVRAILEAGRVGEATPRLGLEERFLVFLDQHGLPRPRTNVWMQIDEDWIEADCVWREPRVIVELDGRDGHVTWAAAQRDRRRDRRLEARGWRVIRITWSQLDDEPAEVAADLRALLRARGRH